LGDYMESLNMKANYIYTATGTVVNNIFKDVFMHDNQRQTLLSYFAGVLDSDGSLMLVRQNNSRTGTNKSYMPCIKIAMVQEEAIACITNDIGYGKYTIEGTRPSRPNCLPLFIWVTRKRAEVELLLEEVLPYMKVKKKQAEFLLEYCRRCKKCSIPKFGLAKEELDYREDSYQKMKVLNKEAYDRMRKFPYNKVAATTEPQRSERINDSLDS